MRLPRRFVECGTVHGEYVRGLRDDNLIRSRIEQEVVYPDPESRNENEQWVVSLAGMD